MEPEPAPAEGASAAASDFDLGMDGSWMSDSTANRLGPPEPVDGPAAGLAGPGSSAPAIGAPEPSRPSLIRSARPRVVSPRIQSKPTRVGKPALALRGLAFLWCAVSAVLVVTVGGDLSPWLTRASVGIFGILALYGLVTVARPVSKGRLTYELVSIGVVSAALWLAPQLLASPKVTGIGTAREGAPQGMNHAAPTTPLGQFAGWAQTYAQAVDDLASLDRPAGYSWWQRLEQNLSLENLRALHVTLDDDAKARVFDLWSTLRDADAEVQALVAKRDVTDPGYEPTLTADDRERLLSIQTDVKRHATRLSEQLQLQEP
jgi:hypothetical protein